MADGGYQRTCKKCQQTWFVPAELAEERPDLKSITSQMVSTATSVQQQMALRQHYLQLGAAAKCPRCGATSWTQQPVAEMPASPEPASSAAPDASTAPAASGTPAAQGQIFVLNQQLVSLTGDAWIEDGQGNHAFEVDGQLLSLRGTHVLKDLGGQTLYEISSPLGPHLHRTIEIKRGGQLVATVQEAIFNLGGDKFTITLAGGQALAVKGDWLNREFQVTDASGQQVMTASRAWFTIRDAYGILVAPGYEAPLALAIAIALERVEAQERGQGSPLQNLLGNLGPFS